MATWRVVLRVLKPGAHAVVFTIPKHIGFVQVAMQEAGFEFRDVIVWAFGSGFPKSHDVSKGIDRALETERNIVGNDTKARSSTGNSALPTVGGTTVYKTWNITAPGNLFSDAWNGWGTALKPAVELIILARKP